MWIAALLLIPVSLAANYLFHAGALWVFILATIAIVPLAEWIRRATDQMAKLTSPAVGGLLNLSFGNLAEFILAIFVLLDGHAEVVKGQITGSIIGNSLLGLGLAILFGTWMRGDQSFERARAGQQSSLLILAVVALLLPAVFHYTEVQASANNVPMLDERLSLGVATVLILTYVGNLIYTLVTHRNVFASNDESDAPADWSMLKALAVLVAATAATALEAEIISDVLVDAASALGVSAFFLGVTILAVVGNASEYISAVYFARKGNMDLAVSITIGSTIQVALLLAPLLVIVSWLFGKPMDLVLGNGLELFAIPGVAFIVNAIAEDAKTTWFEGLLLIVVYVLLGLAFFFVTPPSMSLTGG